jgi:hypothetical protein
LASDRNTLPDNNLQDPLKQRSVLRIVEDTLDDVETVRREGNTDSLWSATGVINFVSLERKEKWKKDGKTHLLELSIPLTSLKHALDNRLQS